MPMPMAMASSERDHPPHTAINRALQLAAMALLLGLGLMIGCQEQKRVELPAEPLQTLSASEIRQAYNRRVGRIDRFWARSVVEVDWVDAEGKSHFEQGDGPLIVRKPAEFALAVGKLGNTILWLGRDAERYWLLELKPPGDQPATAYVGRIDELDRMDGRSSPLPIRADRLIELLGVTPLPEEITVTQPADQPGLYQVVGAQGPGEPTIYWWLDRQLRPVRIGFVDAVTKQVVAEAKLSGEEEVRLVPQTTTGNPEIAGRIEIRMPARRATMRLFLSDATTKPDKFRDAQFDFESLVKSLKPQRVQVLQPAR
jgi:hypothetical protein